VRVHLYEFRNDKKKLKCSCGWERTLKSSDPKTVLSKFDEHRSETAGKGPR